MCSPYCCMTLHVTGDPGKGFLQHTFDGHYYRFSTLYNFDFSPFPQKMYLSIFQHRLVIESLASSTLVEGGVHVNRLSVYSTK